MPTPEKVVEWWQKEREIKAIRDLQSKQDAPGAWTDRPKKSSTSGGGCGAILIMLLLLGGCGVFLQERGCVASPELLAEKTQVVTTGVETRLQKGLTIVGFSVKNTSKWPVSALVRVEISKTTAPDVLLENSVKVLAIPAHGSLDDSAAFESARLNDVGITSVTDPDMCRIRCSIIWAAKVGQEPKPAQPER